MRVYESAVPINLARLTACNKSCLFRTLLVPSGRWVTWRMDNNFGRRDSKTDEGSVSLVVIDGGIIGRFSGRIGPEGYGVFD